MPGMKNPTAPQIPNTASAMQAYPIVTIPAGIAHQFTCRRGSEGIVTVISRTLPKMGDRHEVDDGVIDRGECGPAVPAGEAGRDL